MNDCTVTSLAEIEAQFSAIQSLASRAMNLGTAGMRAELEKIDQLARENISQINKAKNDKAATADIPPGVFFSPPSNNFFSATNPYGLGREFRQTWYSRRAEFPQSKDKAREGLINAIAENAAVDLSLSMFDVAERIAGLIYAQTSGNMDVLVFEKVASEIILEELKAARFPISQSPVTYEMQTAFINALPTYGRDEVDYPGDTGNPKFHKIEDFDTFANCIAAAIAVAHPTQGDLSTLSQCVWEWLIGRKTVLGEVVDVCGDVATVINDDKTSQMQVDGLLHAEITDIHASKTNALIALFEVVKVLYFHDGSDYESALWKVVEHLAPELGKDLQRDPATVYENLLNRVNAATQQGDTQNGGING